MTQTRPPEKPPSAHDDREIDVRSIAVFAGVLLAAAVAIHVGLWVMNAALLDAAATAHGPVAPMAAERPRAPAAPRLQSNPVADLRAYRDAEEEHLASYGWIDQARGVVHIPLDRAIELVAQRGLPSRPPLQPPPPVAQPTESSLGIAPRGAP